MNKVEARKQLDAFLKGKTLHFTFENFPSGEWIATCDEIPGIVTGGIDGDITSKDALLRAAIVTAAGVPEEHADVLNFVGLSQETIRQNFLTSFFKNGSRTVINKQAEYVLA
jgi:hypothetical protein